MSDFPGIDSCLDFGTRRSCQTIVKPDLDCNHLGGLDFMRGFHLSVGAKIVLGAAA